ncbi:TonB-dependent receptor [Cellvibrio sp. ARAG 10.3]|uniref:TonB-dependent receptor n=1 Tax=Cellvibrio sp. ARAG 10.3 TaxID=3451358 RepID=UPI003F480FBE
MNRKFALLSLVCAAQATLANDLEGVILNEQGRPIAGAAIEVVGGRIRAESDQQGRFVIPNLSAKEQELHIKAPGFSHRVVHVGNSNEPVSLTLTASPLEIINVVGLPWHASNIESAQPISVLADEQLRRRQASTLGDTLKYEVGVHSSYYGPVASSPIIRGMDGPRVLITQNSLDAGDASRVGPDHAVATETSTASQIEILRGPATLFYGSGAIGGVVNIVDNRVPQSSDTRGEFRAEHNSVADDQLLSGSLTTGTENIAVHLDGFWRDADDYKIPGNAAVGGEQGDRLANSAYDAQGVNLGSSVLLDNGFVGVSVGRLERTYGIPGHSHRDEDVPVHADLEQDRIQLNSELTLDHAFFSGLNTRFGYTDYSHDEIELDQVATTFSNESYEARAELFHHPLMDWRGAFTLHYKRSDFYASGAEAFTPPSLTETWALALLEERHFGELLIQLGGRVEHNDISTDRFTANMGLAEGSLLSVYAVDHQSTPFSASAGAVWEFTPGYNLAVSLSHAQRTPSASELFSYGAHIGSGLFEVGSLLAISQAENGNVTFDLSRQDIELEKSNNIDISLRKFTGDVGFITNIFYNAVEDYYYLANTGLTQQISHQHDDHFHYFDLPVYLYQAQDVNLYGAEGEFIWQVNEPLKLTLMTDYIRAELRDGGDLPRTPPLRVGGKINYQWQAMAFELSASHYLEQDKVAELETETDGYTLVDMQITYDASRWAPGVSLYVKGSNLTDEYARVHSSFLKDKAPLPARAFALGISGQF